MKQKIVWGVALCLVAIAGCDAEVDTVENDTVSDGEEEELLDPENTFFSRTRITLSEDGQEIVEVDQVSLAQQIAEREAEELGMSLQEVYASKSPGQLAALTSSSCSSTSLRLYGQPNYQGPQLCLSGTGAAALGDWQSCSGFACCSWGKFNINIPVCTVEVNSYRTGQYNALFAGTSSLSCAASTISTPANTSVADAVTAVENSLYVARNASCAPQ